MIDTKYGLKYPMPHSVVHIVDSSMYTGELPTIIADDPSLFASIVVTGAPMGEDNKVVSITRSDVLNTAFGMNTLTPNDRKKFGQTVEYANSLISQGAPVRFMRITPEDSTFGFSCVAVLWRLDGTDNKIHVRFEELSLPDDIQLSKFKNSARLNAHLTKTYVDDAYFDGTYTWKRRVFMTYVSAGRGKVYNYMANAINTTTQAKRPPNVRYEFVTIDTRTNQVCERFYASLINVNNINRTDSIETVNNVIGRRIAGSSIITPFLNEKAVEELYNDYMNHFKTMIDSTSTDEFTKNAYIAMNINIFDMIYGNYIYNGTDATTKLPFYQVDMVDTDIPSLPVTNRISVVTSDISTFDTENPTALYEELMPLMYGVTRDGDNVYVGDLYLTTGTNNTNPTLSIVGAINQYSGLVTSLSIPKIYPLRSLIGTVTVATDIDPVPITTIFNDTVSETGSGSTTINNLVSKGIITVNSVVAQVSTNSFKLYTVIDAKPDAPTGDKYSLVAYTTEQIYQAIAWSSHSSGSAGTGNIIGHTYDTPAYIRVGATVINQNDGTVWINDYTYDSASAENDSSGGFTTEGRIQLVKTAEKSLKFGTCPSDVNITTDIIGAQYDVLIYSGESVTKWALTDVDIIAPGNGYKIGDTVETTGTLKTKFKVESVDEAGGVTLLSFDKSAIAAEGESTIDEAGDSIVTTTSGAGTGLILSIKQDDFVPIEYEGDRSAVPTSIVRYVVSGVQGSLFRVNRDSSAIIPANYYNDKYGINLTSEVGGIRIKHGSTGFFDDETMSEIEFKWRYSALLVKAYRGQIDPRIMSPTRTPAKFLFDGGHNTIVGQTILPYVTYTPTDIINASTIFTADEKEEVMFTPQVIGNITQFEDIDVKQAMYDLMVYRCYQGIPEDKRPIGPGSGLSLHLDSGITDANTAMLMNTSFIKRFNNPNASWDIGGWVDMATGISYTFTKQIVDNLVRHSKETSINKPYVGKYTTISKDSYSSYFPDIDTTDWDLRELYYNSGGNAWIADINGNLTRRSQRTLLRDTDTSDLIQESNMRTLSQLVYLLQNKIDSYLLEYNDDGVLKTLSDEVNNMFSNWVGRLVDGLEILFERDINIDGGEIIVCYCNVTFRGLILRVPIIVNVNRRDS